MTHPPLVRADYLRGAEEAERLGNYALAGTLKSLALAAPASAPGTRTERRDVDALKAQIAEAEEAGDWPRSGSLKSQLLDSQRAPRA